MSVSAPYPNAISTSFVHVAAVVPQGWFSIYNRDLVFACLVVKTNLITKQVNKTARIRAKP